MKLLNFFLISILIVNNCSASDYGYGRKSYRGLVNPPPHNPYNFRPDPRAIPMPEGGWDFAAKKGTDETQWTSFVKGALFAVAITAVLKYTDTQTDVQPREMLTMQKYLDQWHHEGFAQDAVCSSVIEPQKSLTLEDVRHYALQKGRDSCKKLKQQLQSVAFKSATCPRKAAPFVKSKPRKCKQNYR